MSLSTGREWEAGKVSYPEQEALYIYIYNLQMLCDTQRMDRVPK